MVHFVMDQLGILMTLAISLGLGLLVGLQREHALSEIAGIRTFALITLLGTLSGYLATAAVVGPWVLPAVAVGLAALMAVGHIGRMHNGTATPGITTEVAGLVMFCVGAFLVLGRGIAVGGATSFPHAHITIAVVVSGSVAILLQLKAPLHTLVQRLGDEDIKAIMQFVLIALVILPVLPHENVGPYKVLSPFGTWLVVVLIVALSLAGYVANKLLGDRAGSFLGGVLGGIISSTATTIAYARRSVADALAPNLAAAVIMLASTVSLGRVIVLAAIACPSHTLALLLPLGALTVAWAVLTTGMFLTTKNDASRMLEHSNPAQLKTALLFGVLYAAIKLGIAAGKSTLGDSGLYAIAVLAGLVDLDAITLSTAGLAEGGQLDPTLAWRLITVAAMSNMVFKGSSVAVLGTRPLMRRIAVLFCAALAAGGLLLLLWPHG